MSLPHLRLDVEEARALKTALDFHMSEDFADNPLGEQMLEGLAAIAHRTRTGDDALDFELHLLAEAVK